MLRVLRVYICINLNTVVVNFSQFRPTFNFALPTSWSKFRIHVVSCNVNWLLSRIQLTTSMYAGYRHVVKPKWDNWRFVVLMHKMPAHTQSGEFNLCNTSIFSDIRWESSFYSTSVRNGYHGNHKSTAWSKTAICLLFMLNIFSLSSSSNLRSAWHVVRI